MALSKRRKKIRDEEEEEVRWRGYMGDERERFQIIVLSLYYPGHRYAASCLFTLLEAIVFKHCYNFNISPLSVYIYTNKLAV